MQIGKINCQNSFTGLWSKKPDALVGHTKQDTPVYVRQTEYHPFKDESEADIKQALNAIKNNGTKEVYVKKISFFTAMPYDSLEKYVILSPKLGKKLNITQEEYEAISQMKETPYPKNNPDVKYEPLEVY